MELYRLIARDIGSLVVSGSFKRGDRLPSVRALSRSRGVSVSTALEAYRVLEADGIIEARPRSGYFAAYRGGDSDAVADPAWFRPVHPKADTLMTQILSDVRDPNVLNLGAATPGADAVPSETLARLTRQVVRTETKAVNDYADPQGVFALRRRLVDLMLDRGVATPLSEITVTNGCQEALHLAFGALVRPGEIVAIESPTYPGALHALRAVGAKVVEVPAGASSGLDVDALEHMLRRQKIAACYVTPRCSNPVGATLPRPSLERLCALARTHDFMIVEDDTNWGLSFARREPPTLKSFDADGRVVYCSSFSKTVSPGLRVGWVVSSRHAEQIQDAKYVTNMGGSVLSQLVIARYLGEGRAFQADLDRARDIHRAAVDRLRRAVAAHFPAGAKCSDPSGGTLVWVRLPDGVDGRALRDAARDRGISIAPGALFSAGDAFRGFVRLGWGGRWSDRLERSIQTLGGLCRDLAPAFQAQRPTAGPRL